MNGQQTTKLRKEVIGRLEHLMTEAKVTIGELSKKLAEQKAPKLRGGQRKKCPASSNSRFQSYTRAELTYSLALGGLLRKGFGLGKIHVEVVEDALTYLGVPQTDKVYTRLRAYEVQLASLN